MCVFSFTSINILGFAMNYEFDMEECLFTDRNCVKTGNLITVLRHRKWDEFIFMLHVSVYISFL